MRGNNAKYIFFFFFFFFFLVWFIIYIYSYLIRTFFCFLMYSVFLYYSSLLPHCRCLLLPQGLLGLLTWLPSPWLPCWHVVFPALGWFLFLGWCHVAVCVILVV